jgi:uncharacterized protein (UPF0333 family)
VKINRFWAFNNGICFGRYISNKGNVSMEFLPNYLETLSYLTIIPAYAIFIVFLIAKKRKSVNIADGDLQTAFDESREINIAADKPTIVTSEGIELELANVIDSVVDTNGNEMHILRKLNEISYQKGINETIDEELLLLSWFRYN